jgi:hypothetical protein
MPETSVRNTDQFRHSTWLCSFVLNYVRRLQAKAFAIFLPSVFANTSLTAVSTNAVAMVECPRCIGPADVLVFLQPERRQTAKCLCGDFESVPFEFVDGFAHRINIMENHQTGNQVEVRPTFVINQAFE